MTDAFSISRRLFFRKAANSVAAVAVVAAPAVAEVTPTHKPKTKGNLPDFKNDWNVDRYIDWMRRSEPCDSFYRGERLVAYSGWFPELVGPNEVEKNKEFIAALKKRGHAHQVPDGMSVNKFMDRLYRRGSYAA